MHRTDRDAQLHPQDRIHHRGELVPHQRGRRRAEVGPGEGVDPRPQARRGGGRPQPGARSRGSIARRSIRSPASDSTAQGPDAHPAHGGPRPLHATTKRFADLLLAGLAASPFALGLARQAARRGRGVDALRRGEELQRPRHARDRGRKAGDRRARQPQLLQVTIPKDASPTPSATERPCSTSTSPRPTASRTTS